MAKAQPEILSAFRTRATPTPRRGQPARGLWLLKPACLAALLLGAAFAGALPAAAESGKSFFFATRRACVESRYFPRSQCENAFNNVEAELRARAPTFAKKTECALRFGICEGDPQSRRFAPTMIGVEIFDARSGGKASPVLGKPNPAGLFAAHGIAREEAPDIATSSVEPSRATSLATAPLLAGADSLRARAAETPAERKQRITAAPFVE